MTEKIEQKIEEKKVEEKVVETPKEAVKDEKVIAPKEVKKEIAKKINEVIKTKKKEMTPALERVYVIPLRKKVKKTVRYKKANKAIKTIKEFLARHMKVRDRDLKKIKLDKYLNEAVWFRGIKKPPIKIKVKAVKEGDIVRVELAEMPDKLKFKKLRHEKRDKKAMEFSDKKKSLMERAKEGMQKPKEEKQTTEEKKEEKEKKSAVVEAGKKLEKDAAQKAKHSVGGKTKETTRPLRQALAK
jgi:large subunit ribosomal protein L31e